MRSITVPAVVATLVLAGAAPARADVGDVIVRYRAGADATDRADARRGADVRRAVGLPVAGMELVEPEPGVGARSAIAALENDPDVLYAEPDVPRRALITPNDRLFRSQWGLENVGQSVGGAAGTADADIDATDAWRVVTGSPGVVVAVIDTGIAARHPDLAPNLFLNAGEVAGNGVDDDANGVVDDVSGANVTTTVPTGDPADGNGHGTHVAGTVAARGNDGVGVTGVAWRSAILPVKALGDDGSGSASDVIRAYGYAVRMGARVVNLSLGGGSTSRAERDAIASAPGVLFVAAAGNAGADNDVTPSYPCNHDLANVLCVAASDRSDGLAGFSNFGAQTVDLAAPGVAIASTWLRGEWALLDGTSMAAPHVAGAAALLLDRRPEASAPLLRRALLESVDRRDGLARTTVTGGRLNAAAAVVALDALTADPTSPEGSASAPDAQQDAPPAEPAPAAAPAPAEEPTPAPTPAPAPSPEPTTTPLRPVDGAPMTPPAPPDRSAPLLRVTPSTSLPLLLRRGGLRVSVRCSERCVLRLDLRRGGTRAPRAVASRTRAGTVTTTLRLSALERRRLRTMRSARLTLRVRATDAAGNSRTVTRRVTLRR